MRRHWLRQAVRYLAQGEAVGSLVGLLLPLQLLSVQGLLQLLAEAVLPRHLEGHAGPVVADRGKVGCKNVALREAANDVWESCVGPYPPTVC